MYKAEQKVIEDMIITENSPGGTRFFTGGNSVLELPFTISFKTKGEFRVVIDSGHVKINKID